jgi:3-phenylpropionate/trans-cinnamate dioxygenase ferredoxin reductase subunit
MSRRSIVIIGAGHAGVQAAASLREEGSDDAIVLLSGEPELPYQRPPLSKAFLKGAMDRAGLPLRAEQFYREKQIDLRLGVQATRIDLAGRRIELGADGAEPFDHLILATGARPRPFAIPGAELDGVLTLRNIADAAAIRERLGPGRRVVVIGAGFIGLEIAATALAVGGEVTVVEIARPLGRAVSPPTSASSSTRTRFSARASASASA